MPIVANIDDLTNLAFDFVIVGGGSAGCALASRISEDSTCSVLLIEAGKLSKHPLIRVPIGVGKIWAHRLFDWQLNSVKTSSLHNREIELMRGKLLGGSSAINAMSYVRGAPADYDSWQDAGCEGWSFDDVEPFFRKIETWTGSQASRRGTGGPVTVSPAKSRDALYDAWFNAAKSCGHNVINDYNALLRNERLEGFARSQQTIGKGFRVTAFSAYLAPHLKRRNLHILTDAHVARIKFKDNLATGLDLVTGRNQRQSISIKGSLILSAGAFHTPHILMQSGIGPEAVLKRANIPLLIKAEDIGRHYRDHVAVQINFRRKGKGEFHHNMRAEQIGFNFPMAALFGWGPATILPGAMHGFARLGGDAVVPDIQFLFRGAPKHAAPWWPLISSGYEDGFGIRPVLLHPASHGTVEPVDNNPLNAPKIDGRYLAEPGDVERMLEGVDIAMALADDPAMQNFRADQKSPIPDNRKDRIEWLQKTAVTAHHPCGTCRMGPESSAPLDINLRLRGIDNMLVVDASVFPKTISGNINACVYMLAEKTAAMLAPTSAASYIG